VLVRDEDAQQSGFGGSADGLFWEPVIAVHFGRQGKSHALRKLSHGIAKTGVLGRQ
jgi:hypothetical protein